MTRKAACDAVTMAGVNDGRRINASHRGHFAAGPDCVGESGHNDATYTCVRCRVFCSLQAVYHHRFPWPCWPQLAARCGRVIGPRPYCRCRSQPWLTSPRVGTGGQQCWLCTPGYRQPPNRTVWTVYTGLQTATKPNSVDCVHRATDSHQTEQCGLCTPGYSQPPNRTVWTVYTGLQTATKPNSVDCVHRATDSHQTEQCGLCTPGYRQPQKPNSVDCVHRATDSHQTEQCGLCTPGYRQPQKPNSVDCVHRATASHQTEQRWLCTPGYSQPPNQTVWTVYTGLQPATKPNSVDCVHRAIASHQTEQCRYHVPVSTLGDSNVDCVHRATD